MFASVRNNATASNLVQGKHAQHGQGGLTAMVQKRKQNEVNLGNANRAVDNSYATHGSFGVNNMPQEQAQA